ncbi:MAG: DUF1349 domain-containing protein [Pirellulaceae bacterium]|nr:DUF1349 domain-containing protein [Pirellulaceae bacterium]
MTDQPLHEQFSCDQLDSRLCWQSPPARWQLDSSVSKLRVWTDAATDFWQRTHYGFRADNGHLLHLEANGDFQLQTRLYLQPQHQYDQAGLMIWISPSCWIKTSVEFEPDIANQLGAVVTNSGYSDWSTQPIDRSISELWFQLRLTGQDVMAHCSQNGRDWQQLRVAALLERRSGQSVRCGLYACSPQAAGFQVDFDHLRFDPL